MSSGENRDFPAGSGPQQDAGPSETEIQLEIERILRRYPFDSDLETLTLRRDLEHMRDVVRGSGPTPDGERRTDEPLPLCSMVARCLACQRSIYGCVPDSRCEMQQDCALIAYYGRALRGAATQPAGDGTACRACGEALAGICPTAVHTCGPAGDPE